MKRLLLIPILLLATVSFSQIVDQFNFSGALNANGWSSHSGTAGQFQADNVGSLTYPGLPASVGFKANYVSGNGEDVNKALSITTDSAYYSLIINVPNTTGLAANTSTTGDNFFGFGQTSGATLTVFGGQLRIRSGSAAGTFQLAIVNVGAASLTPVFSSDYPTGTPIFVVVKLKRTTSPVQASLWINPALGLATAPAPTLTSTLGTSTFTAFGSIYLRQASTTGNTQIDEIRAGSTWTSVTPAAAVSCNTTSTINVSVCQTYTVPSGDETYTVSGVYHDTIPNAANCDSIITINLTIKNNTTATISPIACGSYTVPSGDETYTVSGTYMDTIPNAAGCDSILTINLTVSGSITYYQDSDNDGFGNAAVSQTGCAPIAGYVTNNTDCDDTNSAITVGSTFYADTDGDGLGNPAVSQVACTAPANYVSNNTDCDDSNSAIGAAMTYYQDSDGDGFGNPAVSQVACTAPANYVPNNADCNDNNSAIHPGATEIPNNGIDEDCSGSDLNTLGTTLALYQFTGNDCAAPVTGVTAQPANATFGLYGTDTSLVCSQAANVFNYSNLNTASTVDLNKYFNFTVAPSNCFALDLNRIIFTHKTSNSGLTPTVHLRSSLDNFATDIATKQLPNSNYKTDTIDLGGAFDNITGTIEFRWYITEIGQTGSTYRHDDVKVIGNINALIPQTYYADADGDGFGDPASSVSDCTQPAGYVSDNTDCDDTNAEEFPGAVWYADTDNDGLGDNGSSQVSCTQPAGYVSDNTDCDDTNAQIGSNVVYYVDADGDGYGDANDAGTNSCAPIAGSVTNNDDCDDADDQINPAATEVCDGVDNNCDGNTDEGFLMTTYYEDADNDTYGNPASSVTDCTQPAGYVINNTDCNDTNAAIHPGAADNTGNGIDENCDGVDGVLGIEESILANLTVYPNPGTNAVVLSMTNGWEGFQVTFVSADGKEMTLTSAKIAATELEFNTESLVRGVYFIRLTSASGTALVRWVKN